MRKSFVTGSRFDTVFVSSPTKKARAKHPMNISARLRMYSTSVYTLYSPFIVAKAHRQHKMYSPHIRLPLGTLLSSWPMRSSLKTVVCEDP